MARVCRLTRSAPEKVECPLKLVMGIMKTARPIHPGEILREEFLAPRELSARALAIALEVPAPQINDVVRERRDVTPDIAQRLARFFDTTPEFWLGLQASYDSKLVRSQAKHPIEK